MIQEPWDLHQLLVAGYVLSLRCFSVKATVAGNMLTEKTATRGQDCLKSKKRNLSKTM